MQMSARNQLRGIIQSIKSDEIMAEVVVRLSDGQELVSVITRTSAEGLNLKQGDSILAVIKSTEVMLGRE